MMKLFAFASVFAAVGSLAMADGRTHVYQITTVRGSAYVIQADQIPVSVRRAAPRSPAPTQAAAARPQTASAPTPRILELERTQPEDGPALPRARLSVR